VLAEQADGIDDVRAIARTVLVSFLEISS